MHRVIFLSLILIFANDTNAQKVVDCSKMTPSQLRNVDDVEVTCKKKQSSAEKKQEDQNLISLAKKEGKNKIASMFKDPDSVKFRDLRISNDGMWICGEVNAKNSYGGYVGYKRFYSLWAAGVVDVEGSDGFISSYLDDKCGYDKTKVFK